MIYIIWLILFSLIIFSYLNPEFIWVPIIVYLLAAGVRIKQKIGDYHDWKGKNNRDEIRAIDKNIKDWEMRGLAASGMRLKEEEFIKEDFKCEFRKRKRQFETEIIDSLFLRK